MLQRQAEQIDPGAMGNSPLERREVGLNPEGRAAVGRQCRQCQGKAGGGAGLLTRTRRQLMQGAAREAALQRGIDLRQAKGEPARLLAKGGRAAGVELCDRPPKLAKRVAGGDRSHSIPACMFSICSIDSAARCGSQAGRGVALYWVLTYYR